MKWLLVGKAGPMRPKSDGAVDDWGRKLVCLYLQMTSCLSVISSWLPTWGSYLLAKGFQSPQPHVTSAGCGLLELPPLEAEQVDPLFPLFGSGNAKWLWKLPYTGEVRGNHTGKPLCPLKQFIPNAYMWTYLISHKQQDLFLKTEKHVPRGCCISPVTKKWYLVWLQDSIHWCWDYSLWTSQSDFQSAQNKNPQSPRVSFFVQLFIQIQQR